METRSCLSAILAFCLFANAFCAPVSVYRLRRQTDNFEDLNDIDGSSTTSLTTKATLIINTPDPFDDDDDDDDDDFDNFSEPAPTSSSGGSNIFSLLNIVTALLPGSSSAYGVRSMIKNFFKRKQVSLPIRRQFVDHNEIDVDDLSDFKTSFRRQENDEDNASVSSNSETQESEEDNAEEQSIENESGNNDIGSNSKQNSDSNLASDGDNGDNDSDYDSEEPPGGGDGGGGGILGLLAGLSGGEDGQSDLGDLLATVSGIIANLSGDGIDLNSLIASGIGLFVGLLSEGEENPGAVIASYLLTSLDTITEGGAKNNGAFFGSFLSKLVKGTSAGGDPDASSEENGNNKPMADSAGFVASFLMSILGDMSKSSSGGSSHPW